MWDESVMGSRIPGINHELERRQQTRWQYDTLTSSGDLEVGEGSGWGNYTFIQHFLTH